VKQSYVIEVYKLGHWIKVATVRIEPPKGKRNDTLPAVARPVHMPKQA
jgi:hypothetical protein